MNCLSYFFSFLPAIVSAKVVYGTANSQEARLIPIFCDLTFSTAAHIHEGRLKSKFPYFFSRRFVNQSTWHCREIWFASFWQHCKNYMAITSQKHTEHSIENGAGTLIPPYNVRLGIRSFTAHRDRNIVDKYRYIWIFLDIHTYRYKNKISISIEKRKKLDF